MYRRLTFRKRDSIITMCSSQEQIWSPLGSSSSLQSAMHWNTKMATCFVVCLFLQMWNKAFETWVVWLSFSCFYWKCQCPSFPVSLQCSPCHSTTWWREHANTNPMVIIYLLLLLFASILVQSLRDWLYLVILETPSLHYMYVAVSIFAPLELFQLLVDMKWDARCIPNEDNQKSFDIMTSQYHNASTTLFKIGMTASSYGNLASATPANSGSQQSCRYYRLNVSVVH